MKKIITAALILLLLSSCASYQERKETRTDPEAGEKKEAASYDTDAVRTDQGNMDGMNGVAKSGDDMIVDVFFNRMPFDQLLMLVAKKYALNVTYRANLESGPNLSGPSGPPNGMFVQPGSGGLKKEISVNFKGTLKNLLAVLSKSSGYVLSAENGAIIVDRRHEANIKLNLKGAKFGDALRALSDQAAFNYSIASGPSGVGPQTNPSSSSASPGVPQAFRPIQLQPNAPGQPGGQGQGMYDIVVNFAYTGDSVDEAVTLLCQGADVYCEKKDDMWVISRYETYIIDKDVYFTYNIAGGATGGGASYGAGGTTPQGGTTQGGSTAGGTSGTGGSSTSGYAGQDGVSISGNFDDFEKFLKPFLSTAGEVHLARGGYVVVVDTPSAISKIRQIVEKDHTMNSKMKLKVDVILVALNNDNQAGVNWNAVWKDLAVTGTFAPAGALNVAYSSKYGGNPVSALMGMLGNYGDTKLAQSWDTDAVSGIPVFFNVTTNIPYFTAQNNQNSNTNVITYIVNYVNVGLKIKILPNVHQDRLGGGIYTELSQLISMDSSGGQNPSTAPRTQVTNTATPLDLKIGNSIILTGYKSDQNQTTSTGVPQLSRIPLLGALFGSQQLNHDKNEFAIVVTALPPSYGEKAKK